MTRMLKEKIARRDLVTIINPSYPSPGLVETLGRLGFDAVFVDCEKYSHTIERIEEMARAGRAGRIATLVRPWSNDPGLISRYLDVGVDGIIAASIETPESARDLIEAVRYARYSDYGDKIILPIVESPEGVGRLPALLDIDEVDAWIIGMSDLAQKMGYPGRSSEPAVQALVARGVAAIVERGRASCMAASPATAAGFRQLGVTCFIGTVDQMLARGAENFRQLIGAGSEATAGRPAA